MWFLRDYNVRLDRLQYVIKRAARLIFSARRRDHVTPLLEQLHWLPVRERIDYKLFVLVYCYLNNIAPAYLASDLQRVSGVQSRRQLRSAETAAILIPRTRTTLDDRSFPVVAALACRTVSLQRRHFSPFVDCLKLIYFAAPITTASDFVSQRHVLFSF